MAKKPKDFYEVTEEIREALLPEFSEIKKEKELGDLSESYLDYLLARDRKAAIIMKTLQLDIQKESLELRMGKVREIK